MLLRFRGTTWLHDYDRSALMMASVEHTYRNGVGAGNLLPDHNTFPTHSATVSSNLDRCFSCGDGTEISPHTHRHCPPHSHAYGASTKSAYTYANNQACVTAACSCCYSRHSPLLAMIWCIHDKCHLLPRAEPICTLLSRERKKIVP